MRVSVCTGVCVCVLMWCRSLPLPFSSKIILTSGVVPLPGNTVAGRLMWSPSTPLQWSSHSEVAKGSEWGNGIPSDPPGEIRNVPAEEVMSTLIPEGGAELGSQGEVERAGVHMAEEESDSCRGLEEGETWTSKRLYKAVVLCICDRDFEADAASAPHCMILGQSPTLWASISSRGGY